MKFFIAVTILSFLLFPSCENSKKEYRFILNDTFFIKQTSIEVLEKKYPIRFGQYEGFYFRSKDSTIGNVYLNLPEQEEIENDLIDSSRITQLRKSKVDKILLFYTLVSKDQKGDIKRMLKKRFPKLGISDDLDSDDILVMDDKRRLICTVSVSSGNYSLECYPVRQ